MTRRPTRSTLTDKLFPYTPPFRSEPVVLEDHGEVAVAGGNVVDALAVDPDLAGGRILQPRDHAHRRRLAAARGPEQDQELLVGDVQRQIVDGDDRSPGFHEVMERNGRHGVTSPRRESSEEHKSELQSLMRLS